MGAADCGQLFVVSGFSAMAQATLYYIHDPMCSWCWGFRPVWLQVQKALAGKVNIHYLLGGLAADSDAPMPVEMQANIKDTWAHIQKEIPGTVFNFDFWTQNQPRRSTYPSCRAVIAATLQGQTQAGENMLLAIQQAYYQQAKNPSDSKVLIQRAVDCGLDSERFAADLFSEKCEQLLQQDLQLAKQLGVNSFPNLVLSCNGSNALIAIDYTHSENIVASVLTKLRATPD